MTRSISNVIAYCDETTVGGRPGFGILLIPTRTTVVVGKEIRSEHSVQTKLLREMERLLARPEAPSQFHFNKLSGNGWTPRETAHADLLEVLARYLEPFSVVTPAQYLGCKAVACRYELGHDQGHWKGSSQERKQCYRESVIRACLKVALKRFYDKQHQVMLQGLVYDNKPFFRELSKQRIVHRLFDDDQNGSSILGGHIRMATGRDLVWEQPSSDHRRYSLWQKEYVWAHMLQATDVVLGALRHLFWDTSDKVKRHRVSAPMVRHTKQVGYRPSDLSVRVSDMSLVRGQPKYDISRPRAIQPLRLIHDSTRRAA